MGAHPTPFQRLILPGFAFKAVVIGGGYATGRELAEFFLPSGPVGGLLGMALAMVIWSGVCALTFMFARMTGSYNYRVFFQNLLGPFWFIFELAYVLVLVLILSVFGAAAGEIGRALFQWQTLTGTCLFMAAVASVVTFGNEAVERVFKYVTVFLYVVYAVFLGLSLWKFGDRISGGLSVPVTGLSWMSGGVAYASYNVVGAAVILPALRHVQSQRDAAIAGLLCGPLTMLPAMAFFICMAAFYPAIGAQALPSDFLLGQLGLPVFRLIFQFMIFAALLESGSGAIHAINQRLETVVESTGAVFQKWMRTLVAIALLTVSIFFASRFGLVALIGRGYRIIAVAFMFIYLLPLATYGVWKLISGSRQGRRSQIHRPT